MILKLSDVQAGVITDHEKDAIYKQTFIKKLRSSSYLTKDYRYNRDNTENFEKIKTETDNIEIGSKIFHESYLEYLENCWGKHFSIVVTPDIIWYTILCEFASLVKANPESYRSLFTDSQDKKEISISSSDPVIMPLDSLVEALKGVIPSDVSMYFPELGFTKNSAHAFLTAFCDTCSPFYNYSMYLCGFPHIDIKGNIEDWKLLKEHWVNLKGAVQNQAWALRVAKVIDWILVNFNDINFWKNIFQIKKCGSGHQTTVSGWFVDLFVNKPEVPYVSNYPAHISKVRYTQIESQQIYEMNTGLFSSTQMEEFMVPSFSNVIYNLTDFKVAPTSCGDLKSVTEALKLNYETIILP